MTDIELLRENHNKLCELLQQMNLNPLADFEDLIVEEDYNIDAQDEFNDKLDSIDDGI